MKGNQNMDESIFPRIFEMQETEVRASYEKKCFYHERFLYRFLTKKIEGWGVKNFLESEEIGQYALYAVTDFTNLFMKDLEKNGGKKPRIICDKNFNKFRRIIGGYVVSNPEELVDLYKSENIQKIIVMSIIHENEIMEELLKKGIQIGDMISIVSVLYS